MLTPVAAGDVPALQRLLEQDPEYFARVDRAPVRPDEAEQTLADRPPNLPLERKHVFVVHAHELGALDAVVDLLAAYPDADTWYLGLIFIAPARRGAGLGTRLVEATCELVRARGGRALRLAVAVANPDARRLYERLGFHHVERRSRTGWNGAVIDCDVMQRRL